MALETLVAGAQAIVQPLNDNFEYLDGRITTINTSLSGSVTTLQTSVSTLQTNVSGLLAPAVNQLSGTTPTLTDNSEHSITITGNTTFTVPTITETNTFHQMLVLLYMPTAYTIDFGTSGNYFGGYAPDMTRTGYYTVIYEFDGSEWYVGALYRAEVVANNA